jgi:hypothetical protein
MSASVTLILLTFGCSNVALLDEKPGDSAGAGVDSVSPVDTGWSDTGVDACWDRDLGTQVGIGVVDGTLVGAGDDLRAGCEDAGGAELAFLWTAPVSGRWRISTLGSEVPTTLSAWDSGCGAPVDCVRSDADFLPVLTVDTVAGRSSVFSVASATPGRFLLSIVPEEAAETRCEDGIDEDLDGASDCDDADCDGAAACAPAEDCADGVDNDLDGGIDCDDTDCGAAGACGPRPEACGNGVDDDGDGGADCADTDCAAEPACRPPEACDVFGDEDGDGAADCADDDCVAAVACQFVPEVCIGGVDEDGDNATDCADPDCFVDVGCVVVAEDCGNGVDDDGNGDADCEDVACGAFPACLDSDLDADGDGVRDDVDCAPEDPSVATVAQDWYADLDGDGLGDAASVVRDCAAPAHHVAVAGDCDDTLLDVAGAGTWYADADGDSFGDPLVPEVACFAPDGFVANGDDCDDSPEDGASVQPATWYLSEDGDAHGVLDEVRFLCEAVDGWAPVADDCDDADPTVGGPVAYYGDADGDGFGVESTRVEACVRPLAAALVSGDCNDAVAGVNPGATEVCDAGNVDEDCDLQVNENLLTTFYQDLDGDTWGDSNAMLQACAQPDGYVARGGDCDSAAAGVNPGATEVCDAGNVDEDCDAKADDADGSALASSRVDWYQDVDGDGYGRTAVKVSRCDAPSGYVAASGDCNDVAGDGAAVYPGAPEVCNRRSEDCDADVDEGLPRVLFYRDTDGDGFGDDSDHVEDCVAPTGYAAQTEPSACLNDAARNPGMVEVCDPANANNVDENCDGTVDEGLLRTYWTDSDVGGPDGLGDPDAPAQLCPDPTRSNSVPVGYADNDHDCNGAVSGGSASYGLIYYRDADGDTYGNPADARVMCQDENTSGPPSGYVANDEDCNDGDAAISPAQSETGARIGNGVDDNCDGREVCFYDSDRDTYRSAGTVTSTDADCTDAQEALSSAALDCDDADSAVNPGVTEVPGNQQDDDCSGGAQAELCYVDVDQDGYRTTATVASADVVCSRLSGEATSDTPSGDCDDTTSVRSPGNQEVCDAGNVDEDCDSLSDNDDSSAAAGGKTTFYLDGDADTYGGQTPGAFCDLPSGYTTDVRATDCNDANGGIHPGAQEICDASNVDEDCDGLADNNDSSALASTKTPYRVDRDADGYGTGSTADFCDLPGSGYAVLGGDCNDSSSAINPAAEEICDAGNVDEDCDSTADNGDSSALSSTKTTFYTDGDGDGYGSSGTGAFCDLPGGYASATGDCDDTTVVRSPGNTEVCDAANVDEDCDGLSDNADTSASVGTKSTFWADSDGDGWGTSTTGAYCDRPSGYAAQPGDCNDSSSAINPGAQEICDASNVDEDCDSTADNGDSSALASTKTTYYVDGDADGYGTSSSGAYCDQPGGYAALTGDCDDGTSVRSPGRTEACDAGNVDEDCDGAADDADTQGATGKGTYFVDGDRDGYGTASYAAYCDAPDGYASATGDCDDGNGNRSPGRTEACDAGNVDEDCDGAADDADAQGATGKGTYYVDGDADGYGSSSSGAYCDQPGGYAASTGDCDDGNGYVKPSATEVCDGVDNDCEGGTDEGVTLSATYYRDADGDSYGNANVPQTVSGCSVPAPDGYVSDASDCNDGSAAAYPGRTEVCDGIDNDCEGGTDEGVTLSATYYRDADGDGYGDFYTRQGVSGCSVPAPEGYVADSGDCNDSNASVYPSASEWVCDGVDNDCDGNAWEGMNATWFYDADLDGYGNLFSSTEVTCGQSAPSGYVQNYEDCDDSAWWLTTNCYSFDDDADNDGVASIAYGGTDCNDGNGSIYPGAYDSCGDGIDQDCSGGDAACPDYDADGYVVWDDCDDWNYWVNPGANENCSDWIDNDCDDLTDSSDGDCYTPPADSDGDGSLDGDDCAPYDGNRSPGYSEYCYDGIDNDCDYQTDSSDGDCYTPPPEDCGNGSDDDGDGSIDCSDADCSGSSYCDGGGPGGPGGSCLINGIPAVMDECQMQLYAQSEM